MSNQNAVNLLKGQFELAKGWLEGTMEGVTPEMSSHTPPQGPSPIGAQAAHVVTGMDALVIGGLGGKAPLMMSSHAESTGLSEPPAPGEYAEWSRRVQVDLPQLHQYANAVFEGVNEVLDGMTDEQLETEVDMSAFGLDNKTPAWVFNIMLLNSFSHTGEISALKGLQGAEKGYPQ